MTDERALSGEDDRLQSIRNAVFAGEEHAYRTTYRRCAVDIRPQTCRY
ncbi:hypothetical protein ACFFQF_17720 [Haladaptatus pallidirubidus]